MSGGRDVEGIGWFTGLATQAVEADLRPRTNLPQKPGSPQQLALTLKSNLPEPASLTAAIEAKGIELKPESLTLTLEPGQEQALQFDYPFPAEPALIPLTLTLTFAHGRQAVQRWLRFTEGKAVVVDLAKLAPGHTGIQLRGKAEALLTAESGAQFRAAMNMVGGVEKAGFFCHPPYQGGVGLAFGEFETALPDAPCAFESFVGFTDGSTTADGCEFSLNVKAGGTWETVGKLQFGELKRWKPFRADLSRFRGKKVALRLVTDVGPADNSSSDWAAWGEPRIVYAGDYLAVEVLDKPVPLPIGPPPIPLQGLRAADLKTIVEAKVILDGAGVNHGEHTSHVYLNDVRIGITPASRSDTEWSEKQEVPVPVEALKAIGPRNVVTIRNPGQDCFKVRAVHLWFKLQDGRIGTSRVANGPFCSDAGWQFAEGEGVAVGSDLPAMACDIPVTE
jgi:hypothetical protein